MTNRLRRIRNLGEHFNEDKICQTRFHASKRNFPVCCGMICSVKYIGTGIPKLIDISSLQCQRDYASCFLFTACKRFLIKAEAETCMLIYRSVLSLCF